MYIKIHQNIIFLYWLFFNFVYIFTIIMYHPEHTLTIPSKAIIGFIIHRTDGNFFLFFLIFFFHLYYIKRLYANQKRYTIIALPGPTY